MTNEIKEFRDGIFALRTRRFGTVAELMIESLYNFTKSHNQFHDRYDEVGHQRIEIKFSTVMKANEAVISRSNSIDQCKKPILEIVHLTALICMSTILTAIFSR